MKFEIFKIRQGVTQNDDERRDQITALNDAFKDTNTKYSEIYKFLYENLSILDSKASSLLTFNALGLAAISFWLNGVSTDLFHVLLDIGFLFFLLSCLLCLWVVHLWWSTTGLLQQRDVHLQCLIKWRDRRTIQYRIAWWMSFLAVILITVATVIHSAGVACFAMELSNINCNTTFPDGSWGIKIVH